MKQARRIAWLALATLLTANANASVTATLDRQTIDEMGTVQLTVRTEGASQADDLDLGPLEREFEVLGINNATQVQIVNGQVSQWVEHRINLRPKRSGWLDIPPLRLGGQRSPPLRLQVVPLDAGVRDAIETMILFEAEASPNPVRVQAQTILTRSLLYTAGVQVHGDLPAAPEIPGALVIPLGEDRSATAVRQGRQYGVLEQRYALFPERNGQLRIPEVSVNSSVRLSGPAGERRSGIRVSTPEIWIDVLPIPSDYPADQPWLPAEDVSITQAWQPTEPSFQVGEPVQRTVTVTLLGNTGSAVPPLNLSLSERFFKQYPEPVRLDDGNSGLGIQGSRRETHTLIPVHPGEAQLPPLRLTWWDSVNEQVREAVLPGRELRITGEASVEQGSVPGPKGSEPSSAANAQPPPLSAGDAPTSGNASHPAWLLALAATGFLGWTATWLLMRRRRPARAPMPRDPAAAAWKGLGQACKTGQTEAMRNAWLKCLSAHWRLSAAKTLARIRRTPQARELLERLNRALYASDPSGEISGEELLGATRALLKEEREAGRTTPPLSALHG